MDDEKLIELVREYEFIYNLKHPKYMDTTRKDKAWRRISDELKQPAAACKQRWQSLRDAYRRAINKRKRKSEQAAHKIKYWKYESEMAYLAPYFTERRTQDSVENEPDPDIGSDNTAPTDFDVTYYNNGILKHEEISDIEENTPQDTKFIIEPTKRTRFEPEQSTSAGALHDDQNQFERGRSYDELDRFFLTISDTVKKFSPYLQALAKNKIFTLVSEMELEQVAPSRTTQYNYTSSPHSSTSSTPMPTSPHNE